MKARQSQHWVTLAGLLVATGCSSEFVCVSGKLTYKGQPVPSTLVTFLPAQVGQRPSSGVTGDDGSFRLTYSRSQTGAKRGPCTVYLTYTISLDEELNKIPPKASREVKAIIAKYGDPSKSPLHYEISKNGQFFEIALE